MHILLPLWTDIYVTVLSILWGACIGSFANVCIYRMPRGISAITRRMRKGG